ncbi:hypothetical protein VP199E371_P0019 [Vibrio phage 199E37-1]|nr:hypothetical protein VP199E371_P0019 [Vibrio phage 199E37-1]
MWLSGSACLFWSSVLLRERIQHRVHFLVHV